MRRTKVVDWLLEPDQPAIRYLALRRLLGRSESDDDVRAARRALPSTGFVAELLASRDPGGWWVHSTNLYTPKYRSTNWQLLALAELGATREIPEVQASAELWFQRSPLANGGIGGFSKGRGHLCFTGNLARAAIRLGYVDDPRLPGAFEWLVEQAAPRGGWSCFGSGRNLDSWEGLSAFAIYPEDRWTTRMRSVVDAAAEFYLQRELHVQGEPYAPWLRTHDPVHYYYDLLVGLDLLTALGHGDDPRMRYALDWLTDRRRKDGRWNLDAVHPDVDGSTARWFDAHPKQRPNPLAYETQGRPSKMVTLRALTVLDRADRA